jgi:hypothetical protein
VPEYRVLVSEEAAQTRRRLSDAQGRKLLWWRDRLAQDPTVGESIRKGLIPKALIRRYAVDNLWRLELPDAWRVLYTIAAKPGRGPEVFILRILTHKEYDRLFGYATS